MNICHAALAGALVVATIAAPVPAAGAAPTDCGANLAAPEIRQAVATLAPYAGTDWAWSTRPSTYEGNYNPCATLSTALVPVDGATASSPVTALMFHHGNYLGTATSKAYGFTFFNPTLTTDDTVVLNYDTPGVCDACIPSAVHSVRYQWQRDHVVMLDPAPPS